jgi:hypothetical protein
VSFYDEVLRELLLAIGAALFIGNLIALVRRRAAAPAAVRAAPGVGDGDDEPEYLERAPVARTVLFMVIGFVVMVTALAALIAY